MEKSQDALKTIGEMSKALDVQPHILRYWEEQFKMLNPLKRAGGRRYYRAEDAKLLHEIHRLIYSEGFTIKGAQKYLRDMKKPTSHPISVSQPIITDRPAMSDDIYEKLSDIANGLRRALAA